MKPPTPPRNGSRGGARLPLRGFRHLERTPPRPCRLPRALAGNPSSRQARPFHRRVQGPSRRRLAPCPRVRVLSRAGGSVAALCRRPLAVRSPVLAIAAGRLPCSVRSLFRVRSAGVPVPGLEHAGVTPGQIACHAACRSCSRAAPRQSVQRLSFSFRLFVPPFFCEGSRTSLHQKRNNT